MRPINEIRKDNKPIVFLGSCYNVQNLVEICHSSGRHVIGLIDPDYRSQKEFHGLPVLEEKPYMDEPEKYEFFVATWWTPFQNDVHRRDIKKRQMFLDWMESYNLTGATIIHETAVISPKAMIDQHVSVGALSILVQNCQIHKHTNIREQCYVSHDVVVESNCVLQIKATVTGGIHIGSNTYIGPGATLVKGQPLESMHVGNNVTVHPNQLVVSSIPDNTVISYKKAPFTVAVDQ